MNNKFITAYVNIAEMNICRDLNKQMQYINESEEDLVTKKECIKFLKSIKKNIIILCALKRKKFNNEPK